MDCIDNVTMMYQPSFNLLSHSCWQTQVGLIQTTRWHWLPNLEWVQKHNHLPATYIYMSNSTGVPSLWVKQLESTEQHFPPTELEFQCVRYIKQLLLSKMMKYRFSTNTNRICLMYSTLCFSMHDWIISVCSVSALDVGQILTFPILRFEH